MNSETGHPKNIYNKPIKTNIMIRKGTEVTWKWGNGEAVGKVTETHAKSVTKTLKGSEITRNGSKDNKALLITQEDGSKILKLESEVSRKS